MKKLHFNSFSSSQVTDEALLRIDDSIGEEDGDHSSQHYDKVRSVPINSKLVYDCVSITVSIDSEYCVCRELSAMATWCSYVSPPTMTASLASTLKWVSLLRSLCVSCLHVWQAMFDIIYTRYVWGVTPFHFPTPPRVEWTRRCLWPYPTLNPTLR